MECSIKSLLAHEPLTINSQLERRVRLSTIVLKYIYNNLSCLAPYPGHWKTLTWPEARSFSPLRGEATTTVFPFGDMDIEKDGNSVEVPYEEESPDEI